MRVLRTAEAAFAATLRDFPYPPSYFTSRIFDAEIRIAYYDVRPPASVPDSGETDGCATCDDYQCRSSGL